MRYHTCMAGFLVLMIAGCNNARLVESSPLGGCVAVPDSSDSFPSYNMTHARALMKQQCPNGYSILDQKEIVTGQTTTNSTQQSTTEIPLISWIFKDVKQTTSNTSNVRNATEWRIYYQPASAKTAGNVDPASFSALKDLAPPDSSLQTP